MVLCERNNNEFCWVYKTNKKECIHLEMCRYKSWPTLFIKPLCLFGFLLHWCKMELKVHFSENNIHGMNWNTSTACEELKICFTLFFEPCFFILISQRWVRRDSRIFLQVWSKLLVVWLLVSTSANRRIYPNTRK